MNHHSQTEKKVKVWALTGAPAQKRVAGDTDTRPHISRLNARPTIFLLASFSPSHLRDGLTQGYKWHEFLSIIPPPFPLSPVFLPRAVEIKDCWAKGKKDSINLRLSLTVTFTWQSCTALCEMRLLLARALAYAPWNTVSFFFIKFRLMGLPRRLGRRGRIMRTRKIMGSVSWPSSHVSPSLF